MNERHKTVICCGLFLSIIITLRISIYFQWINASVEFNFLQNELFKQFIKMFLFFLPLFLLWRRYKYCQRFNQLPGFKTQLGLIGNLSHFLSIIKRTKCYGVGTMEFVNSIHQISMAKREENKGLFALWIGPQPFVIISSPELLRELLTLHGDLKKGQLYKYVEDAIGVGLLTLTGAKWTYHRKLLTPTFNFKLLNSFVPNMQKNVGILMSKIENEVQSNPDGMVHDLAKYIFPCTLDILCQSSMGLDVQAQLDPSSSFSHSFHELLKTFIDAALDPVMQIKRLVFLRPFNSYGRNLNKQLAIFRDFVDRAVSNRFSLISQIREKNSKADLNNNKDDSKEPFMDTLIREHMQRPENFSLEDVQNEVKIFMAAGHDTTGWALVYSLFMIGHHPDVQAKVHEELDTFFSNYDTENEITVDSLRELKYLEAVIKESMRLYSPIPFAARSAEKDLQVGPFVIPTGAEILIGIHLVHTDPEYWAEPARFKPERFLDLRGSHPYSFIPFSAGPRNCIGQRYAMVQIKSVLAHVMKRYFIQSVDAINSILIYASPVPQANSPIRIKFVKR